MSFKDWTLHNLLHNLSARGHTALDVAIARGDIPPAKTQLCQNCGKPAQEWHHHQGYDEENRLNVIPLCIPCHRRIEQEQGPKCHGITAKGQPCNRLAVKGDDYCRAHRDQRKS